MYIQASDNSRKTKGCLISGALNLNHWLIVDINYWGSSFYINGLEDDCSGVSSIPE